MLENLVQYMLVSVSMNYWEKKCNSTMHHHCSYRESLSMKSTRIEKNKWSHSFIPGDSHYMPLHGYHAEIQLSVSYCDGSQPCVDSCQPRKWAFCLTILSLSRTARIDNKTKRCETETKTHHFWVTVCTTSMQLVLNKIYDSQKQ